ncbi:amidase [Pseudogemmobacter faecipullorum]|uniref:Amidase n=1 Tax=Pseudogemmobacter faecipullorum TaxID=2755041 RepID=A0ABS8CJG3_9RHOB|nr:amidase [Pseudogemmobacter faecipullorum]MCB5409496.1 amidase [Pseudogemmobacter faecipullorum]
MTLSPASDLARLSASETVKRLCSGHFSAEDRIRASLERACEVQAVLNPFTRIFQDEALSIARDLDRRLAAGEAPGPLAGVPVAIKDFTPSRGHPATRGSWSQPDLPGERDPVIIARLRAAGAIIIGKTTTPEFAYSGFTQSPRYGVTRNPHDASRSPGGSSGGAAVAVASHCVPLAEGTDMGGSVRIPAALCGVVGLKPSLGRIPMDILPGCFDDISHFGPLAGSVAEAMLFLQVSEGPDNADILSQTRPEPLCMERAGLRGKRIAYSPDLGYYALHPGVRARLDEAAAKLREAGALVEELTLPWTRRINDLWGEIWGVTLAAAWGDALRDHRDQMDPHLVALMESARDMGAIRYKQLEEERSRFWHPLADVLNRYDVLLCPSCAKPAPPATDSDALHDLTGPEGRYHGLDMTSPFNLFAPCPAISLPAGFADGLPVGLQLVGQRQGDGRLLSLALAVEAALQG